MQGAVREVALDILADGSMLPCLVNAVELRDDDGMVVLVRATLFEATARRRYERELLAAQRAAEESRRGRGRCSRWCPTFAARPRRRTSRR